MLRDETSVLVALASVLDDQRERILSGNFDALTNELEAMEVALTSLRNAPISEDEAHRLLKMARRNAGLLEASARGVRSVRRRLGEIGSDRIGGTYTADGRRVQMDGPREIGSRS